jgi:hypothetical protein
MLAAAMPFHLAVFYRRVQLLTYAAYSKAMPEEHDKPTESWLVCARVGHRAAILLASAIWHPWISAPTRRLRVRRLQRILEMGMPERTRLLHEGQHNLRKWERSILRGNPLEPRADLPRRP